MATSLQYALTLSGKCETVMDTKGIQSVHVADFPVLLLPGTACDERLFHPVLERLGWANFQIGAFGDARSTAEAAERLLKQAPPVFDLVGFSLGGIVALEMLAQAPERIRYLALLDTTARADPPANAASRQAAVNRARDDGMETYIVDNWRRLVATPNLQDLALKKTILDMALSFGWEGLETQSKIAIHRENSLPRLATITHRTLLLAGYDDVVCPLEAQMEMAAGIPHARFIRIAGAGHFCPLEKPDETADHLRHWRMPDVDTLSNP